MPYAIGNSEEPEVRAREASDDLSPLCNGRLRSGACGKISRTFDHRKKKGVLYGNEVKIWLTQSFSVYQLLLLPSFNFFSNCKSRFVSSCFGGVLIIITEKKSCIKIE